MPSVSHLHNQPELTVSQLAGAIKKVVEGHFEYVRVRGEISGFKRAASGHLYFDLKDENAVINTVCWKGVAAKMPFQPEAGLEVVCTGKISTYPGRSNYQLIVEWMEPAGAGALMALLEKRKKELAAEGLFAPERKKPLPFLPQVIGVVTSPTGAVIRDILHRLEERFPVRVIVWPVLVQGEGAAEQVTNAINGFNSLPERYTGEVSRPSEPSAPFHRERSRANGEHLVRPDLLIVARGGGSIEDLWAFNEEIVVRAAAASTIPLISAVGHETDTTLIDFVSDRRAPTPTAAAEIAVPVRAELQGFMLEMNRRLELSLNRKFMLCRERLEAIARALLRPQHYLGLQQQKLDELDARLAGTLRTNLQQHERHLANVSARLSPDAMRQKIKTCEQTLQERDSRLTQAWRVYLQQHTRQLANIATRLSPERIRQQLKNAEQTLKQQLERMTHFVQKRLEIDQLKINQFDRLLASLDYHNVLKRGYAIIRDEKRQVLSRKEAAEKQANLSIEFADGELAVTQPKKTAQGSLF